MKRTLKGILSLCLLLALLVGASNGVSAATATSVWVNGIEMTDGDYLASNSASAVTAGAATEPASYVAWFHKGTLTLNNTAITNGVSFTISGKSGNCGICADGDLNIILDGENTIKASTDDFLAGIAVNGKFSVSSVNQSKLTVTGKKAGIYSNAGDILIKGNADISATGAGWINDGYGYAAIFAMDGDVIMTENADVKASFGKSAITVYNMPASELCAYNGNVEISGDVSFAIEENGVPDCSYGIYAGPTASANSGNLAISNGAVVDIKGACLSIFATQNVFVTNASLMISGAYWGIMGAQSVMVDGGYLKIVASDRAINQVNSDPLSISNGSFLAAAAYKDLDSYKQYDVQDFSKIKYNINERTYLYENNNREPVFYLLIRKNYDYESFSDYKNWDWAKPYIVFAIQNNIMGSVNADSDYFDSQGSGTRAMVITVLYRIAGSPELTQSDYNAYNNRFSDVSSSQWYYKAIVWAYVNGISYGTDPSTFAPGTVISREQFVTLLYRYCAKIGGPTEGGEDLARFTDRDQIASYAFLAFQWAHEMGVIRGTSNTTLDPKAICTRGQMATMLKVFVCCLMPDRNWIEYEDDFWTKQPHF